MEKKDGRRHRTSGFHPSVEWYKQEWYEHINSISEDMILRGYAVVDGEQEDILSVTRDVARNT